jgi:Xaa-Pro aminopeptidase
MSMFTATRRDFLRAGAIATAAGLSAFAPHASAQSEPSRLWKLPDEAATLHSHEYGGKRLHKIQSAIRQANLDALVIANRSVDYIGYATNFHPYPLQPGVALIPAEGSTFLFVNTYSDAHTRALRPTVWVDEFIDVPHDPVSEGSNKNLLDAAIRQLEQMKLARGRIGLSGDEIDWLLPSYFREALPSARLTDAMDVLDRLIVVKDETEIAVIRFAQRYIDEVAYPAFRELLRPGEVDQSVYVGVLEAMLERGASPSTVLLFDAGPAGAGTWASGAHRRPLEAGDIILSEPTPVIAGYQSEKMYTFALGHAIPESQKRGADVIYDAFQLVMAELKPGRELSKIVDAVESLVRKAGYPGCTVPIGHWIGTQNHEGPRFTAQGIQGWTLRENMVMSWHPNIVVPGQVRTTCSTCVVIREHGPEDLSSVKMRPIYYV